MSAHTLARKVGGIHRRIWQPLTGALSGPPRAWRRSARVTNAGDRYWGGRGRITGTVKVKQSDGTEVPVHRRVRLLERRTAILVAETWSDATTGAYEFKGVDEHRRFTVLAHDYTGEHNAVVADNVTPEVIA
ncbi:hypothetical protein [Arhodomonas sp. AD133]|uniref:hypothetical protein n=1 Tax=Arhodomonas sp. AD133 TaxID=3415009 RepID=UPI003EBF2B37